MSLRETCHCGHDKATHYLDVSIVPGGQVLVFGAGVRLHSVRQRERPEAGAGRAET